MVSVHRDWTPRLTVSTARVGCSMLQYSWYQQRNLIASDYGLFTFYPPLSSRDRVSGYVFRPEALILACVPLCVYLSLPLNCPILPQKVSLAVATCVRDRLSATRYGYLSCLSLLCVLLCTVSCLHCRSYQELLQLYRDYNTTRWYIAIRHKIRQALLPQGCSDRLNGITYSGFQRSGGDDLIPVSQQITSTYQHYTYPRAIAYRMDST